MDNRYWPEASTNNYEKIPTILSNAKILIALCYKKHMMEKKGGNLTSKFVPTF